MPVTTWDHKPHAHTGTIPPQWSSLPSLRELRLSNNRLSGTIQQPSNASWPSLRVLDMSRNNFSGAVPNLSPSAVLEDVDFSGNRFNGPLPQIPASARRLILDGNPGPSGTLPLHVGGTPPARVQHCNRGWAAHEWQHVPM